MKKLNFCFIFFFVTSVSAGLSELEMIGVSLAAGIGVNVGMTKLFKKKCAVTAGWGCVAATMTASTAVQQLISYGLAEDSSGKYRCEGCSNTDWDPWSNYDPTGNNQENNAYNAFKGNPSVLGNGLAEEINLKENERVSPAKVFKHLLGKTPEEIQNEIEKDLKDLKKKGYFFKDSKLKTPEGLIDPKDLTTDAGLKAAGFSEDEIAALNKSKKKAEVIAKRMNKKVRRGLKRGIFVVRGNQQKDSDRKHDMLMEKYLRDLLGKRNKKTDPTSVVGLSQKHGQDAIGVKSNDIFEMVSRRYEAQRRENYFLPVPGLQSKKSPIIK